MKASRRSVRRADRRRESSDAAAALAELRAIKARLADGTLTRDEARALLGAVEAKRERALLAVVEAKRGRARGVR